MSYTYIGHFLFSILCPDNIMTKEELTEDIIRKLGLLSFLINEVATSLKYSSPTSNVQIAEDFYKSSLKNMLVGVF